jgi:hypothetical protein
MNVLIAKQGATGDVVRTTTLLSCFHDHVTWITEANNAVLLNGHPGDLRCLTWEEREKAPDRRYDLVINLEDTLEVGAFLATLDSAQIFGAYVNREGNLCYTEDSSCWFDLSLISVHGREAADRLKFLNRRTYQDLVFSGLGFRFEAQKYYLPKPMETSLSGDVAISREAGPVWPMKNWAYYDLLKQKLESDGITVNILPKRASLLEHLYDVQMHRCLVGGDSLPMHFALGTNRRCVTIFNCTSPWEIYDYGLQTKIVSPLLGNFFYQRGLDGRATTAVGVDEVFDATMHQLNGSGEIAAHQV